MYTKVSWYMEQYSLAKLLAAFKHDICILACLCLTMVFFVVCFFLVFFSVQFS